MVQPFLQQFQQSSSSAATAAALTGCWKLEPGRAISLFARERGTLCIAHGRVWATVDGPHTGHGRALGDLVLGPGGRIDLAAGQGVVIEPWGRGGDAAVYFSWESATSRAPVLRRSGTRWQHAVSYPLRDLAAALGLAGLAVARLAGGLLGYREFLVAGRGRVLPGLESNQP